MVTFIRLFYTMYVYLSGDSFPVLYMYNVYSDLFELKAVAINKSVYTIW